MLLAIDIGNTNIKLGVFQNRELISSFRVTTKLNATADEYGVYIRECLNSGGLKLKDIKNVIISSVIPMLNYTFEHLCVYYFKFKPIFVTSDLNLGMQIDYKNPSELGADRIVSSVAALKLYGDFDGFINRKPVIVVDFGTAMTINVIQKGGVFLGGLICPGVKTSADSLVRSTARLPNISLKETSRAVSQDTITNIQSGLYYGYIGAVEYIVGKIKEEESIPNAIVVATGGLSELFRNGTSIFAAVDRKLSLLGLDMIFHMNMKNNIEP